MNWTSESPLVDQDGSYTLHVRELVNGTPIESSMDTIDFTIDRVAPNKPSLAPALSHGFLGTDQSTATVSGTTEALAEIKLLRQDGSTLATTTATEAGAWSIDLTNLPEAIQSLTLISTDQAGNVSEESVPLVLTSDLSLIHI